MEVPDALLIGVAIAAIGRDGVEASIILYIERNRACF